jgi:hypothetical protein
MSSNFPGYAFRKRATAGSTAHAIRGCSDRCRDSDGCIKIFTTAAAFLPIRVGDLLNTETWGEKAVEWPLLRVVNAEHLISESTHGIDPSGGITHRILLYTESVPDTVESRCKSRGNA